VSDSRLSPTARASTIEPTVVAIAPAAAILSERLVKSERLNFYPGTEVFTVAERYRRLLITSSAQIFAGLCSTLPIFAPSSPIFPRAFSTSSPNQDIRF
jgi:hypothetical protein